MYETDYTIKTCGTNVMVWKNSKVEAQGLGDVESALHAIWVLEGKKPDDFFVENGGIVSRVDRGEL